MLRTLLIIGAGSALGGICRYLLGNVVQQSVGGQFPWGTLAVNLIGCVLIGAIYGMIDRHFDLSQQWLLFLTTGFCGGLTTFSTFIHENYLLFTPGRFTLFALYVAASIFFGLLCAWLGHALTRLA